MPNTSARQSPRAIHPLHALLIACALPLFLGGLLSDLAYARSYEVQWNNFAQWLLAGAMVFNGLALLWSFVRLFRPEWRAGWAGLGFVVLLGAFTVGLIDSFAHTRDAFGTQPEGVILSAVASVLALTATWLGFSSFRPGRGA